MCIHFRIIFSGGLRIAFGLTHLKVNGRSSNVQVSRKNKNTCTVQVFFTNQLTLKTEGQKDLINTNVFKLE